MLGRMSEQPNPGDQGSNEAGQSDDQQYEPPDVETTANPDETRGVDPDNIETERG